MGKKRQLGHDQVVKSIVIKIAPNCSGKIPGRVANQCIAQDKIGLVVNDGSNSRIGAHSRDRVSVLRLDAIIIGSSRSKSSIVNIGCSRVIHGGCQHSYSRGKRWTQGPFDRIRLVKRGGCPF